MGLRAVVGWLGDVSGKRETWRLRRVRLRLLDREDGRYALHLLVNIVIYISLALAGSANACKHNLYLISDGDEEYCTHLALYFSQSGAMTT